MGKPFSSMVPGITTPSSSIVSGLAELVEREAADGRVAAGKEALARRQVLRGNPFAIPTPRAQGDHGPASRGARRTSGPSGTS